MGEDEGGGEMERRGYGKDERRRRGYGEENGISRGRRVGYEGRGGKERERAREN